jgi:glycosyltransferase involved in cell wall biosynthesis
MQLAAALRLSDRVHFPGVQSHSQVAEWLGHARAFAQHSVTTTYGDSEGTPVAVLEAAATGLPVVATAHAGIQEAVISGETGFLVPELDVAGMAKAMIRLAEDSQLAGQMGERGRDHMKERYSIETTIGVLSEILHRARTQS